MSWKRPERTDLQPWEERVASDVVAWDLLLASAETDAVDGAEDKTTEHEDEERVATSRDHRLLQQRRRIGPAFLTTVDGTTDGNDRTADGMGLRGIDLAGPWSFRIFVCRCIF
uniref:Uncharacterized protein n=1 Tax=Globodera rostochiensis TaxID=31243 RepID=A0A914HIG5_GLORO